MDVKTIHGEQSGMYQEYDNEEYDNDLQEKEDIQRKEKNTFQPRKEMDVKEKGKNIKLTLNRKKEEDDEKDTNN